MSARTKSTAFALLAFSIIFPFVFLLLLSFASEWRFPEILPGQIGIRHWAELFSGGSDILTSLALSLSLSLSVAVVSTSTGFMIAKAIAYSKRREQFLLLAYFPYILPPVLYAASLNYFFAKFNLSGSVGGVILAQLLIAFPFSVIFFSGYWNLRLKSLEELVATLGGNSFQTLFRVLVPLSKGMLLVCFFQTFLISWFEYGLTLLVGVGKVQTLALKVYQYIAEANPFYAALSSCLLVAPPLFLLWFNKKYVFRRII